MHSTQENLEFMRTHTQVLSLSPSPLSLSIYTTYTYHQIFPIHPGQANDSHLSIHPPPLFANFLQMSFPSLVSNA